MRVPFYEKPAYTRFPLSSTVQTHMMEVIDFLKWVLNRDKLEIADYLGKMGQDPFFLVAATGLGKTVGVPIHVLIRQIQRAGRKPHPEPRVWVVEPRIPIAVGQAAFMNSLWKDYSSSKEKSMFRRCSAASRPARETSIRKHRSSSLQPEFLS